MKRMLAPLLALLVLGAALAQTNVTIMGQAGQFDIDVVNGLINEVINDELAAENITVEYQPLQGDYNATLFNALSAGTAADLFWIPSDTAPGLVATGKVLPLDDVIDTEPFIDSLVDTYTFDDQVYGIAKDFNTLALFYNKDLFDEAGVEYPNENDTWETLAEKIRAVDALGDDVYGACFPASFDRFGAFAYANGWEPLTEDGEVDLLDENFTEAINWYTGLIDEGVAVQPSAIGQDWGGGCFATGNVGVTFEGAWLLSFLADQAPNLQYGTTFLPLAPSGERGNFLYTVAYGVNTDSPNQEAALRVLELLTSEEAQQYVLEQGLAIPSREGLADNPYFDQDTPQAEANEVVYRSASMGNVNGFQFGTIGGDYMAPINDALASIVTGQTETEAALQQAQENLAQLIERAQ